MTSRSLIAATLAASVLLSAGAGHAQAPVSPPAASPATTTPAAPDAAAPDDDEPQGLFTTVNGTTFHTGLIPEPKILLPKDKVTAEVVLISDAGGWSDNEQRTADGLLAGGAIVIGIDLPTYLAEIEKDAEEDCSYLVADIEDLSQQTQRAAANDVYRLPIVAGIGAGGAMALAIAAQTPDATIGGTLAVDPDDGISLKRVLCTPATRREVAGKAVYGLTDGPLPDPISVIFTPGATEEGREHVDALLKAHDDIDVDDSSEALDAALASGLKDLLESGADESETLGLPITVLETKPTNNVMAIIYSGDGGWRDLDKTIGDIFQKDGVPTIGVDSLHYFWSERTPEQTARDLQKIIDTYRKRWRVDRVLLVGYSFGADVLPAAYHMLSKPAQASVAQLSLLGFARTANYQISVMGWLGVDGKGDADSVAAARKIDPKIVQCVYGADEDDSACLDLKGTGVELLGLEGGHHFDGDYEALAAKILASLKTRIQAAGSAPAPKGE